MCLAGVAVCILALAWFARGLREDPRAFPQPAE
jgi:hypothetical protein